jgi:hypothetical protein
MFLRFVRSSTVVVDSNVFSPPPEHGRPPSTTVGAVEVIVPETKTQIDVRPEWIALPSTSAGESATPVRVEGVSADRRVSNSRLALRLAFVTLSIATTVGLVLTGMTVATVGGLILVGGLIAVEVLQKAERI